ncbi:hypothetical protein HAHI6034_06525 [Hathewaya histolytica]|uniref:Membrane protein n=1 Tax=Hathewaya histolytica TaxID=1498 RepID=A0A4V6KGV2_HATHI|nr:hypothetical protein [Hathewaya histolytica]VTQ95487.1 membrane protein [Hathewaya histolytica]
MKNFIISGFLDLILVLISYFIFRAIINGPTRHKIYEKLMSSFAKFIIFLFVVTVAITGITAVILYKTRYIQYINIVTPALVSIFVGFVVSTVPTRGYEEQKN